MFMSVSIATTSTSTVVRIDLARSEQTGIDLFRKESRPKLKPSGLHARR